MSFLNLPFSLPVQMPIQLDQAPMEMNPQPWKNPGQDPPMQEMLELDEPFEEKWGIFDQDGNEVFDIDTCIDVKFGDKAKVSDFPVEQGAFASYNKVPLPYEPKIKIAVSGQDRVQALLEALFQAVRSTDIYDVYTPEIYYESVTIESYDYDRTREKGRNLVTVQVQLKQVLQVAQQYTTVKLPSPKKASAADKKDGGKVQAKQPPDPLPIDQQNAAMASSLGLNPSSLGIHP